MNEEANRPLHPFLELTRARLLTMLREPEMVFWVFVFPILMALALGVAFRSSTETSVAVGVESARGASPWTAVIDADPRIDAFAVHPDDVAGALRDGLAHVVVVPGIPPTYRFDPTRPESQLARIVVDSVLQQHDGRADRWRGRDDPVVLPGSRYIDWLIPGLLGMNIMGTGMWGIGFSVVVQRSRKLLKRLVATPMRRAHFLGALVSARLVFLGLEVTALVGVAWLVFDIPLEGSLVALASVALLGAIAFGGLGLLVASRARTVEGVSGIMNIVMVPMWIGSGVFFAATNFPDPIQPVIQAMPLTALVDALRGVMLEGHGVRVVADELVILVAWGGVSFGLALQLFRWR